MCLSGRALFGMCEALGSICNGGGCSGIFDHTVIPKTVNEVNFESGWRK